MTLDSVFYRLRDMVATGADVATFRMTVTDDGMVRIRFEAQSAGQDRRIDGEHCLTIDELERAIAPILSRVADRTGKAAAAEWSKHD